jgi:aspartate racemase
MPVDRRASETARWKKVIGIVGGLGPHAHIRFEELLLRAAEVRAPGKVLRDQDYPPYLVSSLPATPDRTEYLLGRGPSPLPWLERSLRALEGAPGAPGDGVSDGVSADFAVIACNTAHALLSELRAKGILPILDVVSETIDSIRERGTVRTVGLLATTGTLEARIYQEACAAHGLNTASLLDLQGGEELQRSLVMATIYGDGGQPGIKAGAYREPEHLSRLLDNLQRAVGLLAKAGAELVIAACTEIPLVLRPGVLQPGSARGIEIVDPLEVAARAAVEIAAGRREVEPDRRRYQE